MTGRPSKFTQELADKICETIATSSKGLRAICAENEIDNLRDKLVLKDVLEMEDEPYFDDDDAVTDAVKE